MGMYEYQANFVAVDCSNDGILHLVCEVCPLSHIRERSTAAGEMDLCPSLGEEVNCLSCQESLLRGSTGKY
jgi:hypothetical protein